jgi:signal transduction histidine kinase/serine phosphatase RsbU (regulator of sigma subunit)
MESGGTEGRQSPAFLAGGGRMGALIRELDWSATPIGPVGSWPQSLRTAVSICLSSRFPILIWWGPELVKLYNDDYAAILGAKHPAALGRPGREVWPEIWHIIGPMLEGVLARGEATWSDDQLLVLSRRGYDEECYFTFSYSPIHDEAGRVGGVFCAVHETTERVLGERRLRTLRALAAHTADARSSGEAADGVIAALGSNPADVPFAALYAREAGGGRGAELAGATSIPPGTPVPPHRIAPGDGPWPVAEVLCGGEVAIAEDGTAVVAPIQRPSDERPRGALVLGVSPRRRLDDDYRDFFALVARDVASALANATAYEQERARAEALAELDRAKTDFFSNISHEFRTPLTLILGPLEEMLRDDAVRGPERERAALAHRNAGRLLRLVNTLLDFSRLEAGRAGATLTPVDVAGLSADLAGTFRSAAENGGLRLVVDRPPGPVPVLLDRELFERALLNLLSNALKFTFEGEIRLRVRAEDGMARIEVTDTGEGIPEDELPRLFERFRRVRDARTRSHEGSGIGLSLVEQVAALHGGHVTVDSEVGRGTTFCLELPLTESAPVVEGLGAADAALAAGYVEEALRWMAAPEPQAPGNGAGRPSVLFADDNADMREYVTRLLDPHYEVRTASDGAAALEMLRAAPADLVLADVMMPGLDGFGLLSAVREDDALRRVPFVMLSARAGQEAAVEGLRAGADDYVVKPFTADELLARVRANLELGGMRNRLAELDREEADRLRGLYDQEHRIAISLQRSLLPERLPAVPFLDLSGSYVPAEAAIRVGGDWYDALALADGSVLLVIGDVAGHGLPAASVMGELRSAARAYALEGHSPAALLRRMDALMRTTGRTFMATCLCMHLQPATGALTYASAGHPPALVRDPDGTVRQLTGALAAPLGFLSARRGPEAETELAPGAALVLYTDGLVERRGLSIDVGIDALGRALRAAGGEPTASGLLGALGAEGGLHDDVAVLVARAVPVDAERLELSLGAVPGSLAPMRRALARWLSANAVADRVAYDILLAVNESATNAIEHAYGPGEATFEVDARRDGDAVHIVVRDFGRWRPARGEHRGRGLNVMRSTMDDVDVSRSSAGSEVRLSRMIADGAGP